MSGSIENIPKQSRNTQGTYDLALGRATHDMFFPISYNSVQTGTLFHTILPIDGMDRVGQQVKMTLLAFLGEWFLDLTFGVPYLEDILIKNPRLTSVESILRAKINDVPDLKHIEFFSLDFHRETRKLFVDFLATTVYGPIKDSFYLNVAMRELDV
jgi:hypothetical protein